MISKNKTSLHSHRHPCRLCLPACPSKIIGRVSTSSCLFIWFPEGDGCLPMPHCLEIPPRHLYSTASHQGTMPQEDVGWRCPTVIFLGNRSSDTPVKGEKHFPLRGARLSPSPKVPHIVIHPIQGWGGIPEPDLSFIFLQRGKPEVAFSRLLKHCLFST